MTVAFIGLGDMGMRMARRLMEAGNELVVWNRTMAKAQPLVERGAVAAESPADATRQAEVAITMVADPDALSAVTEGPEGIAAGASKATTLIQMSTVSPEATRHLGSLVPSLLDAPVLGSLTEAESGTLKVFASGPDALVARWKPLLSVLGSVIEVGPLGAGTAAKLVANSTLLGSIGVLGEALALAQGLGLSSTSTFEVLAQTPLASQAERRREMFETGEFPRRFALRLALKDANLILDAAEASGADLKVIAAAREWLAEANEASWGDKDYAAVLRWIAATMR